MYFFPRATPLKVRSNEVLLYITRKFNFLFYGRLWISYMKLPLQVTPKTFKICRWSNFYEWMLNDLWSCDDHRLDSQRIYRKVFNSFSSTLKKVRIASLSCQPPVYILPEYNFLHPMAVNKCLPSYLKSEHPFVLKGHL